METTAPKNEIRQEHIETFCEILKKTRKEKNLKGTDIAKKLDITQPQYSDIERGKVEPKLSTLIAISNILGVSVSYLVGETPYPQVFNEDFRKNWETNAWKALRDAHKLICKKIFTL